ncbi:MAG: ABC transporter permease [Christensenellales bacterium]
MKKAMTSREKYLALLRRDKLKVRGLQVALLVIFIGVWELATAAGLADSFFVSSPSRIIKTLAGMAGADLMRHVWITLYECILGFVISTAAGVIVAVACGGAKRRVRLPNRTSWCLTLCRKSRSDR